MAITLLIGMAALSPFPNPSFYSKVSELKWLTHPYIRVEFIPSPVYDWLKGRYGGVDLPITPTGDLSICDVCIDLVALNKRRDEEKVTLHSLLSSL